MAFWIYSETEGNTCADAKIGAAMHFFSHDLFEGCKYNAHLAKTAEKTFQVRSANMSCILFSVSAIEAKLNELISMFGSIPNNGNVWSDVLKNHNKKPIAQKWNLITAKTNGTDWNHSNEPFRSYNLVKALRNELVHYKGELLEQNEVPNVKIQEIMIKLGVQSEATFIEDDCSSWANDLLNNKELGKFVVESISPVWENMYQYLGSEEPISES